MTTFEVYNPSFPFPDVRYVILGMTEGRASPEVICFSLEEREARARSPLRETFGEALAPRVRSATFSEAKQEAGKAGKAHRRLHLYL